MKPSVFAFTLFAFSLVPPAVSQSLAGEAIVLKVRVSEATSSGFRNFEVTVKHADEGWAHYADLFQVLLPNGRSLQDRVLAHPHVEEQPFERGARRVKIPAGVTEVLVRARDTVHGMGPEVRVPLPADGSETVVTGRP